MEDNINFFKYINHYSLIIKQMFAIMYIGEVVI